MIREPREHRVEIDGRRDDKRIRNELLFRAVNEKLRALNVEFEGFANETAVFVCECNRIECMEQMELGVEAFDAVCAEPLRFVLVSGHETPAVEQVVGRNGTYVVVEKLASVH
jgi:hypothetical protein